MDVKRDLLEILAEAELDVDSGRVASIEETFTDLRTILKESICLGKNFVM